MEPPRSGFRFPSVTNWARSARHGRSGIQFALRIDHDVETVAGALGLFALLVAARFAPNPEIGFVLQMMGVGGAFGLLAAYVRHRDDPDADRWRIVTLLTLIGISVGLALVIWDHLS